MKNICSLISIILLVTLLTACGGEQQKQSERGKPTTNQWEHPPEMVIDPTQNYQAVISTNQGDITIELFTEEAPVTVNNFIFLARDGFYDNVLFHRVIKDFMIQTGDPTGTGTGGPGYAFKDELPPPYPYEKGIVAMANAGPNTNGSQFFICNGSSCEQLNAMPNYTIFGRVVDGMDVVENISNVPVERSQTGEQSVPEVEMYIQTVKIIEN
jgi:cyclophilin family peptidyl-prolyl cis-trans isomerase